MFKKETKCFRVLRNPAELTPDEFSLLRGYTSSSDKLLRDVIDKFQRKTSSPSTTVHPKQSIDEFIDYPTFKHFIDVYLDADLPLQLCQHLFTSFFEKHADFNQNNNNQLSVHNQHQLVLKNQNNSISTSSMDLQHSNFVISEEMKVAKIPLKDVACYLSLLESGRPEQKLEFMFHLYDKDGNGYLDSKEIENIIEQMMRVALYLDWDTVELKPILEQMLKEIDYDDDGTVTLDEWVRGGMTTIPLLVLLGFDMNVRDDGSHLWRLCHFNRPAYCNLCLKLLVGFAGKQGLCCTFCKYTVHERCVHKAPNNCITTYAKSRKADPMTHHWVEANRNEKCAKCRRSVRALEGKRCRWCRVTLHALCATQWTPECDLGSLRYHILPPTCIFPVVLQKRNGHNRLSQNSRKKSSVSAPHSFQIVPLLDTRPLVIFINPKSGGKQGERLYRKFQGLLNPRQVFNLNNTNPFEGLQMFSKVPNVNVLCCGGDGTIGWILDAMDKIEYDPPDNRPPIAILPLGTGNDLARCLRWGGGYQNENLSKFLQKIEKGDIAMLDRWQMEITSCATPLEEKGDPVPSNIMNNYFSIGVDASIAHRFHQMREKHPERFNSRMKNKFWYFEFGTSETLQATCKHLHEYVEIVCDNVAVPLASGQPLEGIAFLNIPSIYGGSNLWGTDSVKKRQPKPPSRSGVRSFTSFWPFFDSLRPSRPTTSTSQQVVDLNCRIQDMGDGMIEVVGIENAMYVGQVKAGLRTSGRRLSQCKEVIIRTKKRFPMQIDGEPWMQPPCEIKISIKNQVPVLVAPLNLKSKSRSPVSWSSFFSHKKRRSLPNNLDESMVIP